MYRCVLNRDTLGSTTQLSSRYLENFKRRNSARHESICFYLSSWSLLWAQKDGIITKTSTKPHQLWVPISVDAPSRSRKTNTVKTWTRNATNDTDWLTKRQKIAKQFRHASAGAEEKHRWKTQPDWFRSFDETAEKELTLLTMIVINRGKHFNARPDHWFSNLRLGEYFSNSCC